MFSRLSPPADLEDEVLAFWKREAVFDRVLEQGKGKPRFVFFEGPPTANGLPHNGHVLTRVIKDVVPRYRTMRGYDVQRKAGWDTHGLPVEVEVEKALGLKGRQAIVDYGLADFAERCRDSVFVYTKEWEDLTEQIGFWADLDNAYVTYHRSYVESVWWALARLFDKGLLYKGHKVVWWWPQGGTTLSAGEVGQGYKEVDDPAVTVRFRSKEHPNTSFLAWTTTPWTLPSNVALAVGLDIPYAFCRDTVAEEAAEDGVERWVVVAEARAEAYGLTPERVVPGAELVGHRYEQLFPWSTPAELEEGLAGEAAHDPAADFTVVPGEHVTTGSGTGIVHTAPAFGEDDMKVAQQRGLGIIHDLVAPDGTFTAKAPEWVRGHFVKVADKAIIANLRESHALFKRESYRHDYPFCWRADDDPLIQYARPAWFVRTTSRIDEVLRNNQQTAWHPEHIQEGRFGDFLRNNVDWALSRERFWGTPLNIWECEACEDRVAPPSTAWIKERNPDAFDPSVDEHLQVHRPWIDRVTLPCEACGGTMHRVPEVIDVWFDSGCMPFAQWGFPHQGQQAFREQYPADFISEAIDQTRGWFYSLMMISTLLFDDATCEEFGLEPVGLPRPYKNCIVLGHVTDMDGRKESKSKGNYTSPNLVLRGFTRLAVLPDASLKPGTVGMKRDQVRSLDLPGKARVTLFTAERPDGDGPTLQVQVGPAEVRPKDTVHLHPDDLAALGLPAEGGRLGFAIPGEPPGADAFRWLFCASNPPWSSTRLSFRAIREGQREFLIRLRNVYQFFGIYADIAREAGTFDPSGIAPRLPIERAPLDRWVLHRLGRTTEAVTEHMDGYRIYEASRELLGFVDDLSNWYVRRSRSRFWGEGPDLEDALWTLYEVLVTTAKLIAPFVPFTAEALYRELVAAPLGEAALPSVHLAAWPEVPSEWLDDTLDADMALVRQIASLGLAARTASKVKVRQPLAAATVVLADPSREAAVRALQELVLDELNVRELVFRADAGDLVSYSVKPNFKVLGKRLGKDMKRVAAVVGQADPAAVKAALDGGGFVVDLGDVQHTLGEGDVEVRVEATGGYEAAGSATAVVALSTELTDDLRDEGFVRELTNRVQTWRKKADLGFTQRIELALDGDEAVRSAVQRFGDHLRRESLVRTLTLGQPLEGVEEEVWEVDGRTVRGWVRPLS